MKGWKPLINTLSKISLVRKESFPNWCINLNVQQGKILISLKMVWKYHKPNANGTYEYCHNFLRRRHQSNRRRHHNAGFLECIAQIYNDIRQRYMFLKNEKIEMIE